MCQIDDYNEEKTNPRLNTATVTFSISQTSTLPPWLLTLIALLTTLTTLWLKCCLMGDLRALSLMKRPSMGYEFWHTQKIQWVRWTVQNSRIFCAWECFGYHCRMCECVWRRVSEKPQRRRWETYPWNYWWLRTFWRRGHLGLLALGMQEPLGGLDWAVKRQKSDSSNRTHANSEL